MHNILYIKTTHTLLIRASATVNSAVKRSAGRVNMVCGETSKSKKN